MKDKNNSVSNEVINEKYINKIHSKVEKEVNDINISKIKFDNFPLLFNKKNVPYKRKEHIDLYNEIFNYLNKE